MFGPLSTPQPLEVTALGLSATSPSQLDPLRSALLSSQDINSSISEDLVKTGAPGIASTFDAPNQPLSQGRLSPRGSPSGSDNSSLHHRHASYSDISSISDEDFEPLRSSRRTRVNKSYTQKAQSTDRYYPVERRRRRVPGSSTGDHDPQDYQIQLMLLEQHKRTRLGMPRVDGNTTTKPEGPRLAIIGLEKHAAHLQDKFENVSLTISDDCTGDEDTVRGKLLAGLNSKAEYDKLRKSTLARGNPAFTDPMFPGQDIYDPSAQNVISKDIINSVFGGPQITQHPRKTIFHDSVHQNAFNTQGMDPQLRPYADLQGSIIPQSSGTPAPYSMPSNSMAMAHFDPQKHMFQQQNPQMNFGGGMSPPQTAMQQQAGMRQRMLAQMQAQSRQGITMTTVNNPNFNQAAQMAHMKINTPQMQQQLMAAHAAQAHQAALAQHRAQQMQFSRSQEQQKQAQAQVQ